MKMILICAALSAAVFHIVDSALEERRVNPWVRVAVGFVVGFLGGWLSI